MHIYIYRYIDMYVYIYIYIGRDSDALLAKPSRAELLAVLPRYSERERQRESARARESARERLPHKVVNLIFNSPTKSST